MLRITWARSSREITKKKRPEVKRPKPSHTHLAPQQLPGRRASRTTYHVRLQLTAGTQAPTRAAHPQSAATLCVSSLSTSHRSATAALAQSYRFSSVTPTARNQGERNRRSLIYLYHLYLQVRGSGSGEIRREFWILFSHQVHRRAASSSVTGVPIITHR